MDVYGNDDLKEYEWVRIARAIGVASKQLGKSFATGKKIADAYVKLRDSGVRPLEWAHLAKATGIPAITELDEIDKMIKEELDQEAILIEAERLEAERLTQERLATAARGDISHLGTDDGEAETVDPDPDYPEEEPVTVTAGT